MGATVKCALGLDTMANDFALGVLANWSQPVNRALEAVERVSVPGSHHLKREVIVIAADFASSHWNRPVIEGIPLRGSRLNRL
jgi:hypothetical protein